MSTAPATPAPFPSARLAALMAARGFRPSSKVVAGRAGISPAFLHRMATDPATNPTWATVRAVCDALGCDVRDLSPPS